MSEQDPGNELVVAKDTTTGATVVIAKSGLLAVEKGRYEIQKDRSAYDHNGDQIESKPNRPKGGTKSTRSASAAPSQSPASKPTTTTEEK